MSAKGYLNRARGLSIAIDVLRHKIRELEAEKTAIGSPGMNGDSVQTSKAGDAPYTRVVEKLVETENLLSIRVGEYSDTLIQMAEEIRGIENPVHSELLFRRYLEFQRFEKISYEMHYSFRYVLNLHRQALQEFERTYPERCDILCTKK